jgi:hypothetical protein
MNNVGVQSLTVDAAVLTNPASDAAQMLRSKGSLRASPI